MDLANLPAGPNIDVLRQGVDLIRQLEDRQYEGDVGMQFRHCFDFYLCLLAGLDEQEVDYERRKRDDRITTDRSYATARAEDLIHQLSKLSDGSAAGPIRTRSSRMRFRLSRDSNSSGGSFPGLNAI